MSNFLSLVEFLELVKQNRVVVEHSWIIRVNFHAELVHFLGFLSAALVIEQESIIDVADGGKRIAINSQFIVLLCFLPLVKLVKGITQESIGFIIFGFELDNLVEHFDGIVVLVLGVAILSDEQQLSDISFSSHPN